MFFFDTTRTTRKVETEIPETEWVARAQRGDEEAFVHLATVYRPRIWSTASRFARSRPELEDLTQDLFLKMRRGISSYRSDAPFENWVMTVTVRGCYDFLRSNRKRRNSETLVDPQDRRDDPDPADEREQQRHHLALGRGPALEGVLIDVELYDRADRPEVDDARGRPGELRRGEQEPDERKFVWVQ
jgi:RNA polymerase sigma factor (sigma-70 family)